MQSCRLFKFSLFTKILVFFLQVLFNNIVPDHNADAFRLPHIPHDDVWNRFAAYLLSGFSRWDGQYFLHIALYGYTHENTLAFFPVFPYLMRHVAELFKHVLPLSALHCNLLSGMLLNMLFSSMATVFLYKLTLTIYKSDKLAVTSALLFCINPAAIFFSAIYSESTFALLTFAGLWALETQKLLLAVFILALSAGTRSNGLLSAFFIVHHLLKIGFTSKLYRPSLMLKIALQTMLKIIICLVLFCIPFVMYQVYCYLLFCTEDFAELDFPDVVLDFVTKNDLKVPSEPSKWCYKFLPIAYSYVQSHYWNLGFLHYFTIKQIPNFLLATPVLIITIGSSTYYFSKHRKHLWHMSVLSCQCECTSDIYASIRAFPYFLHIFINVFSCFLFIHVQVLTRMLFSSSPVLYWVGAALILPKDENALHCLFKKSTLWILIRRLFLTSHVSGKIVFNYFLIYFLLGIFLHVNFLPWT